MQREVIYVTIRLNTRNFDKHAVLRSDIEADFAASIRGILVVADEDGEIHRNLDNRQLNYDSFEVMPGLPEREEE